MTGQKHVAIIGAGPGGYVAAIRAAQLGARVTVVENQALGGVCLNWGCIPSKALLSVVDLGERAKKAADLGLKLNGSIGYDWARKVSRKNTVVSGLVKGIGTLFTTWGIEHLPGTGAFLDERTIQVVHRDGTEQRVSADAVIIATGSSWPNLPLFPVDGRQILTSKEALDLTEIPASLLIIGGGVEGCEFASLYSGMGTHVFLIELMPRILPLEDEEIASMLARQLKKQGVEIRTGTTVEQLKRQDGTVTVSLKDGTTVAAEKLLVSVGRSFNSEDMGLEKVGVQLGTRGEIFINDRLETTVPGIYAIGDVTGKSMLAHVASAQGKVAVENIMGHPREINYYVVPAGIFTLPEIGRVGLTEQQARERSKTLGTTHETAIKVGRFRYAGLGKAQAVGETNGLFKIIADATTDTILGVHIIGPHAADLIHEAALAMQMGAKASDVAGMIHAHPTLSEGIMEAAEDLEGLAIHLARKRT
ncbi:MAG: dihydrolipoyl dehydrogenase [Nitrospiraceae bacterium]|nr:dihydrolipoyl dehydrogenase [Nitrospiraceae bacterium]